MSTPEHEDPQPEPTPGRTDIPLDEAAPEAAPAAATRRDREDRTPSADAFPVPTGPRTTSFAGHLLGILVGLALTLLATILVVLGQSRILEEGVGRNPVTPEVFGIVLLTLGALVAALVILLGLWTPTAPFAGGLVALIAGAAYLFAPVAAQRETVRLVSTQQNHVAVLNSITVGTTGVLFLIGVLLLAAGFAFSLVRRRGLALGAFRERSRKTPNP